MGESGSRCEEVVSIFGASCQRVLCWVSSGSSVEGVVQLASNICRLSGGSLLIVMGLDAPGRGIRGSSPLTPEMIARAERDLSQLYGPIPSMILPGNPVTEVRRYARYHDVDLIVMGAQALAVEKSYSEQLSNDAPCPVVVLHLPEQIEYLNRKLLTDELERERGD